MKLCILVLSILAAGAEAIAIDRVGLNRSVGAIGASCDASGLILRHEGSRTCSYTDTTGHRTVGVGFNMDAVSASRWSSICGSCPSYQDVYSGKTCLSSSNINTLLQYSLLDAKAEAQRVVSNYGSMCCNVQNVVTDMTFNLGSLSGFPTLVHLLETEQWSAAASDMRSTLWCRQVGYRCSDDSNMVAKGCGGPTPPPPSPPHPWPPHPSPNPPPPHPSPNPPSPPPPSPGPSQCKQCVENGGGDACVTRCGQCGSGCTNCIKNGGGRACAQRCC